MTRWTLTCMLLVGCGGTPFTTATNGAIVTVVGDDVGQGVEDAGQMGTGADVDAGDVGTITDVDAGHMGTVTDVDAGHVGTVTDVDAEQVGTVADVDAGHMGTVADVDAKVTDDGSYDASDLGFECLPSPQTLCGCGGGASPSGGNAFTYPAQFCMFPANFSVIVTTPVQCQCAGHYTCDCIEASQPCAITGQQFVNCQIGSTGGAVVTCK